ncbi:MAG: carboxypeptidase-like regulatory domain-containing protein [Gracilimonas sp.]|uniref:carboxypeptidase-like regulatory domain-containing protein n=1 Tax=Gracilimonas sp. TaxID=1974203 RepID=UPI0037506770|nr:carboxypeptidase-like regulatory domain-containing protein [Gracilimonas sp.]
MLKRFTAITMVALLFSLFGAAERTFAQNNQNVSGVVVDAEDGDPLPGVSIQVQGTSRGTSTDIEGAYSLTVSSSDVLIFSFGSYEV